MCSALFSPQEEAGTDPAEQETGAGVEELVISQAAYNQLQESSQEAIHKTSAAVIAGKLAKHNNDIE